jgi:hypothetical protein
MIKAAAIFALVIGLAAAAYLAYLSTVVRQRYNLSVSNCANCTAVKEVVAANWVAIQSRIDLLKAEKKYREAEKLAIEHAKERPVNIDIPCVDCETLAPDYSTSTTVAVIGLIASAVLFGAVKPKRYR